MKMNMNSRGFIWTLIGLLFISIVACVICCNTKGSNYTQDYRIYGEVKDMVSTLELLEYCHANGIEYSINNSKFEMEKYDIVFLLNGNECMVTHNTHMYNIELLKKGGYGFVTVSTEKASDGNIVRTTSYKTLTHEYTFSDGTYRVNATWPAFVSFICIIGCGVALYFSIKRYNQNQRIRKEARNPNMD